MLPRVKLYYILSAGCNLSFICIFCVVLRVSIVPLGYFGFQKSSFLKV